MIEQASPAFRHRPVVLALILSIAAATLWAASFTTDRFVDRDAYDYAQIGRQIRQGAGFTTAQTFPRHLPTMQQKGLLDGDWPSLLRYPVPPALNAVAQLLVADPVAAAVWLSGACFLLGVPLFFLLAARLTDARLAAVATVFYVGDPRIWRDAWNGMTEAIALLILLAAGNLATLPAAREGRRSTWALLGLLCGVAYLTRTQLIALVPLGLAVAALAVRAGRRRRSAVLFLAGALSALSPWLVRNTLITGEPLFAFTNSRNLLAHTASHSGIDRYLHEPVEVGAVLERYHDEILAKIGGHIWPNIVDPSFWIEALGVYAAVFPVLGLALVVGRRRPLDRRPYRHFERAAMILLFTNFLLVCLIYHRQRYYDTMIPLLIIVLVQRLAWMSSLPRALAGERARSAIFVLLMVLAGGRLIDTLAEHRSFPGVADVDLRSYEALAELIDEESVVLSDLSAQVTLYNGNRTVRTPARPEEILEIDEQYLAIDYLLLSRQALRPRYRRFVESEELLARFELAARLPNEALLFRKSSTAPGAATAVRLRGLGYYAAQLHLHGSFSEGRGTMRGHNLAAGRVGGIDVLWWTDHDWRVARHTYLSSFDFEVRFREQTIPHRNVPWKKPPRIISYGWRSQTGGARLAESGVRATEEEAAEGRKSLQVEAAARPGSDLWGWSGAGLAAKGGRFQATLAAEVVLKLAVQPLALGDDARAVVSLQLSRQPEGLAELRYVVGDAGERRVERSAGRVVGVVPLAVPSAGTWSEIVLPVTADAVGLGLGGWDNHLGGILLAAEARRGAAAAVRFDDLRIETALGGEGLLARQIEMAAALEDEFGLVNHVGSEISYSFHMSAYLPRAELPDFDRYPNGMSAPQIVAWAHERGGLVSYNHIFGTAISITDPEVRARLRSQGRTYAVENRAFGTDLLEVGYPQRVEPLIAHLGVWDELSAAGVFLTAIGSSDSHDQVTGWFDGNNFVTWVWAASPGAEDLIAGLRRGHAFLGDPTRFRGTLDLETAGGHPMGRVVLTDRPRSEVRLRLTELPAGTRIRWIVDGEAAKTSSPPAGDHQESLLVDTRAYRFVRVEAWFGERGIAFSNCLYFVPMAEGAPPATHRLVEGRGVG